MRLRISGWDWGYWQYKHFICLNLIIMIQNLKELIKILHNIKMFYMKYKFSWSIHNNTDGEDCWLEVLLSLLTLRSCFGLHPHLWSQPGPTSLVLSFILNTSTVKLWLCIHRSAFLHKMNITSIVLFKLLSIAVI